MYSVKDFMRYAYSHGILKFDSHAKTWVYHNPSLNETFKGSFFEVGQYILRSVLHA